jgi:hypothetical protein
MSLADFLKNIEFGDLHRINTGDHPNTGPGALGAPHSQRTDQTEPPRTNLPDIPPPTTSLSDSCSTRQLAESTPARRGKVIRPQSPSPQEPSSKSRKRAKRSGGASPSHQKLSVAIDELWELLPDGNKGRRIEVSRTEKVEMAIAYLRELQEIKRMPH